MIRNLLAISCAVLGTVGCIQAAVADAEADVGPAHHASTSAMHEFAGSGRMPSGADYSMLSRRHRSVDVELSTSGLDPAAAYTLWAVVFNSPRHCAAAPCALSDLPTNPGHDARVQASMVYVTGGYSGTDGRLRMMGRLFEPSNGIQPTESVFGPGLLNSRRAEVHFILRSHGLNPGNPALAIGSFSAGCTDANPCMNHQATIHLGR